MTRDTVRPDPTKEPLWPKVRGYLLWVISAAAGFGSFMMLHLSLWMIIEAIWPVDPIRQVETMGGIRSTQIVSLLFLAIGWLGWVIAMESYYVRARTTRLLVRRFVTVSVIQLVIAGVYFLIPTVLRWFL